MYRMLNSLRKPCRYAVYYDCSTSSVFHEVTLILYFRFYRLNGDTLRRIGIHLLDKYRKVPPEPVHADIPVGAVSDVKSLTWTIANENGLMRYVYQATS